MGLVAYKVGSELRSRWRAWVAVGLLAAVAAGAITAAVAGARRAESAYSRFLDDTRAFDVLVSNGTSPETINRLFDRDEVAALDDVEEVATVGYYFASGTTSSGHTLHSEDLSPLAPVDGGFGTSMNRALARQGRLARSDTELAVSASFAQRFDVGVGDTVELQLTAPAAPSSVTVPTRRFEVVGVVALQSGIPPFTGGLPPVVLFSGGFAAAHPGYSEIFAVRLADGPSGAPAFVTRLQALAQDEQLVTGGSEDFAATVDRSITVQVGALRILAVMLALGAALVVGQAVARVLRTDADRARPLADLGVDRRQLFRMATARAALVAGVAAVGTLLVAIALSPMLPIGTARLVEPDRGIHVDLAVLMPATAIVAIGVLALGALSGRSRAGGGGERPGRAVALAGAVADAGAPTAVVTGVGLMLDRPPSRQGAPALIALVHTSIAVATIVGVVVFSSSLNHLFDDPQQYGWAWDVQVGDSFAGDLSAEVERLESDPGTDALAAGTTASVQIEDKPIDVLAVDPVRGDLGPVIVDGRAPARADEVALGGRTMRTVGASIGDRVHADVGERSAELTVVGQTVLTEFGGAARLGEGATMTYEGVRQLSPVVERDVVLVRLRPDSAGHALGEELAAATFGNVYLPEEPSDLAELQRLGGYPSVCAALIAATAAAALLHALMASVRERRGDLAILKVLGFDRQKIRVTVGTQAALIAILAAVLGVAIGLPAGAEAWRAFAALIGVPDDPTTPAPLVLVVVGLVLLGAALTALVPAHAAARTPPAAVLRQG